MSTGSSSGIARVARDVAVVSESRGGAKSCALAPLPGVAFAVQRRAEAGVNHADSLDRVRRVVAASGDQSQGPPRCAR